VDEGDLDAVNVHGGVFAVGDLAEGDSCSVGRLGGRRHIDRLAQVGDYRGSSS
jgi:hypothetical protein